MKTEILSEELNAMKYLLGYKRGVVISEQPTPQFGNPNQFSTSPFAPKTQTTAAPVVAAPTTGTTAVPAPVAAAPTTRTTAVPAPVTAPPTTGTTAASVPATTATNLSMPELIKKIQTILKTKFSATLGSSGPNKDGIDGVWGKNSQAAFENALKTLSTKPAAAAPTTGTPAVPAPVAAAPTTGTPTASVPARNFNTDPNIGKGGIGFNRMTPEQLVQGVQSATPPKLPTRDESIAKAKADLKAARGMK